MKAAAVFVLMAGLALAGCSRKAETPNASPNEAKTFKNVIGRDVYWDYLPAADWAENLPVLAIAYTGSVYPAAPDVELAIWCRDQGRIELHDAFHTGDVNPRPRAETIGLSSGKVTLSGTPTWRSTGYGADGDVNMSLKPGQLGQLLSGDALTITAPAGTDIGAHYPAPPKALTEAFLRDCLRR